MDEGKSHCIHWRWKWRIVILSDEQLIFIRYWYGLFYSNQMRGILRDTSLDECICHNKFGIAIF